MDLFWAYLQEVLNIDPTPYRGWGSAKNCYNNFYRIKDASKYFNKIKNSPNNQPKKGDIVFWGTYPFVTGLAGHVAMYEGGNLYSLIGFEQNYPTKSPCRFVKHSYKGVMGWLSPK
jgi:cell wall-associated NlpC family hydrolase